MGPDAEIVRGDDGGDHGLRRVRAGDRLCLSPGKPQEGAGSRPAGPVPAQVEPPGQTRPRDSGAAAASPAVPDKIGETKGPGGAPKPAAAKTPPAGDDYDIPPAKDLITLPPAAKQKPE